MTLLSRAATSDADDVLTLYRSLIGTPGCTWHADYPTAEIVASDLAKGALYIIRDADDELIGAVTVGDATELVAEIKRFDKTATVTLARPGEIARFAVRTDQQGRGLGREILNQAISIARASDGTASTGNRPTDDPDAPTASGQPKYDGLCLLVSPENAPALHLYHQAGFQNRGGLFNWGFQWAYLELRF